MLPADGDVLGWAEVVVGPEGQDLERGYDDNGVEEVVYVELGGECGGGGGA